MKVFIAIALFVICSTEAAPIKDEVDGDNEGHHKVNFAVNVYEAKSSLNAINSKKAEQSLNAYNAKKAARARNAKKAIFARTSGSARRAKFARNAKYAMLARFARYADSARHAKHISATFPPMTKGKNADEAEVAFEVTDVEVPEITEESIMGGGDHEEHHGRRFALKADRSVNAVLAGTAKHAIHAKDADTAGTAMNAEMAMMAANSEHAGGALRSKDAWAAKYAEHAWMAYKANNADYAKHTLAPTAAPTTKAPKL